MASARGPLDGLASRRHRSLWLQEALGDAPDAPVLSGAEHAQIAIVGGGFVGLWTALEIKRLEPSADVAVVEQDLCGGGASGLNGGMVLSWWAKLATFTKLLGEHEALRLAHASVEAIDQLGRFCDEHAIDAEFRRGGWLWTATTEAQLGAWESTVDLVERHAPGIFERLSPDEVAARTGSATHLAGIYEASAAIVQPAKLVRGLRHVALERGVRLYEGTRVTRLQRTSPVVLHTPTGRLEANRVILATNAWAAGLRELHRRIAVISSDIVATAPSPERLSELGWTGGEGISDSQLMVHYYRPTADGRVVFGKGGWGIALGGRIGPSFRRDRHRAADVTADLRRIYPRLGDVPITHDWSGPIDRTEYSVPLIGHLGGRPNLLYGVGWSGNGVGPARVGARILAALATDRADQWSQSPLVDLMPSSFPPEPIRYLGAHLVRNAVVRKERADAAGERPSRLTVALTGLAPGGMTPTKHGRAATDHPRVAP